MRPAGAAEVERAKADGRWEAAYPGQRTAAVPEDLSAALAANPAARDVLRDARQRQPLRDPLPDRRRQAPATRARRIERYVAMLAAGETIHPVAVAALPARALAILPIPVWGRSSVG